MKKVRVSAPGKLMLFGEHAVVYDHPCIVTAVNQRMRAEIELLDNQDFILEAPEVKIFDYKKRLIDLGLGEIPKGAGFGEMAVKIFKEKYLLKSGIKITTKSGFSSQFGFGSSSASTVCVLKGLAEIFSLNLTNRELFDLAYKTVLEVQGKGSGFDVASAIYGEIIYFVTGGKIIEPLNIKSIPLVVAYSGIKADTVQMINKATMVENKEQIFKEIEIITEKAKRELQKSNWQEAGILMNENQKLLGQLGVSIPKLDLMIKAAEENGAWGAKLSGAGGGDCMIALVADDKKNAVEKAIKAVGGEIITVTTNANGVRIEE